MPRISWRLSAALLFLIGPGCSQPDMDAAPRSQPAAPEILIGGKVLLGSPSLTAGIPGEGPLSVNEIKKWLADPKNHETIDFVLPVGLRQAAEQVKIPVDNPLTRAKIELGRQLFFDRRFGDFSCGDCHQPRQFYTAHQVFPENKLNPQVSFNRLFSEQQFWDGKAATLEAQPKVPIKNTFEMRSSPEQVMTVLKSTAGYRLQFESIFGEITFQSFSKALASFMRALVTGPSPYDLQQALEQYAEPDSVSLSQTEREELAHLKKLVTENPMSESARRGQALFFSERSGCSTCHTGPNFTDEDFHNVGVGMDAEELNLGRFKVTGVEEDKGAFKTPTLRNVAHTPPYMHDGSLASLEAAIEFLAKGGHQNPNLSSEIRPLDLSPQEKKDLIEFLKALDSPLPRVEKGRLPQGLRTE